MVVSFGGGLEPNRLGRLRGRKKKNGCSRGWEKKPSRPESAKAVGAVPEPGGKAVKPKPGDLRPSEV